MPDVFPLVGTEVQQLRLDYQVTLVLVDGPAHAERVSATLIVETPFRLTVEGETFEVNPNRAETHSPVCRLLHRTITDAILAENLVLTLAFDDGSRVRIEPHPKYESWQLSGKGVSAILAGPE